MAHEIPSAAVVRGMLQELSWPDVKAMCASTGAPFTTIWKLRGGQTRNPGIETVRLIWPALIDSQPKRKPPRSKRKAA